MKKKWIPVVLVFIFGLLLTLNTYRLHPGKEAIIFFPIDPSLRFENASTFIHPVVKKSPAYTLEWGTDSELNQAAFLRQDISLLYRNGKLAGISKDWKTNTKTLKQQAALTQNHSSYFQAITFHYAEVHPTDNAIVSAQKLTNSEQYVISNPFSTFKEPITGTEKEWQKRLRQATNTGLKKDWTHALKSLDIPVQDNDCLFGLSELAKDNNCLQKTFPEESDEITGKLWEGLYKNYVMGIKQEDGIVTDPLESTMPLIVISKKRGELLVVLTTADGSPVLLRQKL